MMNKKLNTGWPIGKLLLSLLVAGLLALIPKSSFETKAAPTSRVILSNPRTEKDLSMNAQQKTTWDCVWFGRYPQSEVTAESNPALYDKLERDEWKTNDVILDGTIYRKCGNRFFQFDPIKWRVLETDGNTALLLSDMVLDAKKYNRLIMATKWENSELRSWLNGYDGTANTEGVDCSQNNFTDIAFSGVEQAAIMNTHVTNDSSISSEGSDRIFNRRFGRSIRKNHYRESRRTAGKTFYRKSERPAR